MNKKINISPRTVIYNHIQTDERNKDYFLYITCDRNAQEEQKNMRRQSMSVTVRGSKTR